jgi:hypothetical protein
MRTRQNKMPYKHIAAHLRKTELACRLHYHQLSMGNKRRRRGSSVSSAKSSVSSRHSGEVHPSPQQHPPTQSPSPSPPLRNRSASDSHSPNNPVRILPKPVVPQDSPLPGINHGVDPFEDRASQYKSPRPHGVNGDLLLRIYSHHRDRFWSAIAQDYGGNIPPALLEAAWLNGEGQRHPPPPHTVGSAPAVLEPRLMEQPLENVFRPVMSRSACSGTMLANRGPCAISSLLTEDREIMAYRKNAVEA